MKRAIVKFYEKKGFELTKLFRKRPPGIREPQVKAAAKQLYYEIQNGREIEDINIARRIFEIAKTVEYKEFLKEQEILAHDQEIIAYLKDQRLALLFIIGLILAACAVIGGKVL